MQRRSFVALTLGGIGAVLVACAREGGGLVPGGGSGETAKAPLLPPAQLDARIADVKAGKIVVFHVGPPVLWKQQRVPGSRALGPASDDAGAALAAAVKALPADVEVVAYCGCCPVASCPNVGPARKVLAARAKASVLDLPTNFKTDWVDHGYAIERG